MDGKTIRPVAVAHTDFKEKFGVPRQSGRAKSIKGRIVLSPEYDAQSVKGLDGFSHIWLVFGFSESKYTGAMTVRPPRLGGNKRVGVFASRSPNRPNGLGISCVKLDGIETNGGAVTLLVSGIDLIDGTPVYDIKPYHPYADKIEDAIGGYIENTKDYKLKVAFIGGIEKELPESVLTAVTECISDDPRPSYIDDPERIYGMSYGGYEIKFRVKDQTAEIVAVKKEPRS